MHVGHLPLTALEPNLRRNQGGAFRKDRQLQLRHESILPSPSLSRKRTGGQLIFQNGSQNHGMRSGVLKLLRSPPRPQVAPTIPPATPPPDQRASPAAPAH